MSDTLIYAMSTRGSMKIEQFNELFRYVRFNSSGLDDGDIDIDRRRQAIRNLDSLAYCEFDFDRRKVFMCKPTLVLIPGFGLPKALLVGARTPDLIGRLKIAVENRRNKAKIKHIKPTLDDSSIPSALHIHATDNYILKEIADQAGVDSNLSSPAAWNLAQISNQLDEIKNKLNFEQRSELDWHKRTFNPDRLIFSGYETQREPQHLAEYRHPVTIQLYHWIWDGNHAAQIARDWGRYMILAKFGSNILMYDEKLYRLAVPITVPLPCLLARAAALCSGTVPAGTLSFEEKTGSIPSRHPLQIYSGVPPEIARLIAGKLEQKLIYTSLAVIKKGVLYA